MIRIHSWKYILTIHPKLVFYASKKINQKNREKKEKEIREQNSLLGSESMPQNHVVL